MEIFYPSDICSDPRCELLQPSSSIGLRVVSEPCLCSVYPQCTQVEHITVSLSPCLTQGALTSAIRKQIKGNKLFTMPESESLGTGTTDSLLTTIFLFCKKELAQEATWKGVGFLSKKDKTSPRVELPGEGLPNAWTCCRAGEAAACRKPAWSCLCRGCLSQRNQAPELVLLASDGHGVFHTKYWPGKFGRSLAGRQAAVILQFC